MESKEKEKITEVTRTEAETDTKIRTRKGRKKERIFETYFLNEKEEFEKWEKKRGKKISLNKKAIGEKEKNKKRNKHKKQKAINEDKTNDDKNGKVRSPIILQNFCVNKKKQRKLVKWNKYEGGYTIWECTWEMLKFIYKENLVFQKKRVLELGCGSGLIGIYILQNKGTVVFQEFNKEVINDVLLPNIKQNLNLELKKEQLKENASFMKIKNKKTKCFIINKSWDELNEKLEEKKLLSFDYIFGNEILYRYENYNSLLHILETCLKKGGKAFFGSKSFYFGFDSGTGSKHFAYYVNSKKDTPLVAKIIKSTKHKSVYTKDIIQISHKE